MLENKNLKELIPIFHKIFQMLFAEMRNSGVGNKKVKWYADSIATLLSFTIVLIYEDKEEFDKYVNELDYQYDSKKDSILKPEAKA
jgi:hypothetical protein